MELGVRLRQARLEAGLSQRQLCGEVITRNMLSQIENGSARPSMETLRYLASRLGKPMGYFLEEQAVTSPNQSRIAQARQALSDGNHRQVLEVLKQWQGEDPVFEAERWFLEALACIRQAELALTEGKPGYAAALLEQARDTGAKSPYYSEELERSRLLLVYRAQPEAAKDLVPLLPNLLPELLLRAQAAQAAGDYVGSGALLDAAAPCEDPQWQFLRAEAYFHQKDYIAALSHYRSAEATYPKKAAERMEHCCRELEDYKMAYHYACKLRQLQG